MIYVLVFFGTLLEGELTLTSAVYFILTQHGSIWGVIIAGAFGAFIGDVLCFAWGWKNGPDKVSKFPRISHAVFKMFQALASYPTLLITVLRFQMMMRMVGFYAIGQQRKVWKRHTIRMLVAAWVWAVVIVFLLMHTLPLMIALYGQCVSAWNI